METPRRDSTGNQWGIGQFSTFPFRPSEHHIGLYWWACTVSHTVKGIYSFLHSGEWERSASADPAVCPRPMIPQRPCAGISDFQFLGDFMFTLSAHASLIIRLMFTDNYFSTQVYRYCKDVVPAVHTAGTFIAWAFWALSLLTTSLLALCQHWPSYTWSGSVVNENLHFLDFSITYNILDLFQFR